MSAVYPLRERVYGLLMLALYRDDRQGEALAVYQQARRVLVQELGAEPGAELQELHQQILAADRALVRASARASGSRPYVSESVAPRQLPAGVRHFTGRAGELAALTALLDRPGQQQPRAVVVSAISGTAGVGKTALAVHWAHQVAGPVP